MFLRITYLHESGGYIHFYVDKTNNSKLCAWLNFTKTNGSKQSKKDAYRLLDWADFDCSRSQMRRCLNCVIDAQHFGRTVAISYYLIFKGFDDDIHPTSYDDIFALLKNSPKEYTCECSAV